MTEPTLAPKRIGEFLVDRKVLTPAQVEQILEYGRREGLRFGEAGAQLGLLPEEAMVRVFGRHFRVDFFHLDPAFLPRQTALDLDTIIRLGVMPLGFKKQYGLFRAGRTLNLGMLDPGRQSAIASVVQALGTADAGPPIRGTRVFLVLAEQFLNVLEKTYAVTRADLARRPVAELDPTLAMFLGEVG